MVLLLSLEISIRVYQDTDKRIHTIYSLGIKIILGYCDISG